MQLFSQNQHYWTHIDKKVIKILLISILDKKTWGFSVTDVRHCFVDSNWNHVLENANGILSTSLDGISVILFEI